MVRSPVQLVMEPGRVRSDLEPRELVVSKVEVMEGGLLGDAMSGKSPKTMEWMKEAWI